jgi:hypothetical protein
MTGSIKKENGSTSFLSEAQFNVFKKAPFGAFFLPGETVMMAALALA